MQILKNSFLTLAFTIVSVFLFSQNEPLKASLELNNTTSAVNDVTATLDVSGGKEPYIFLWSKSDASMYSKKVEGFAEGQEVVVTIVDSNSDSLTLSKQVPSESFEEKIGEMMSPAVSFLDAVLFKKIWSDTIKIKNRKIESPFILTDKGASYRLKEWKVDNGEVVEHLQVIAIIEGEEDKIPIFSIGSGVFQYGVYNGKEIQAGDEVFYKNEHGEKSAKILANISYDSPQPFYQPNLSNKIQGIPLIVAWLVLGAIFFTFRMGFIQFRPKVIFHSISLVRGKYDSPSEDKGDVTHFQALVTALSATIGLGNIAGVAIAISIGGAGATFWMILAGMLGMVVKFAEATLGVKYRTHNEEGEVSGGPMYYLSRGLAARGAGFKSLGKVLAFSFAVLCVIGSFGIGNMFQANQAFNQLKSTPGLDVLSEYGFYFGMGLAILVGMVIVGGIKSIVKVTDKVVPVMVVVYVLTALSIILINYNNLGSGLYSIFSGAFNPDAVYGGVIGVLIVGFQRAAFSNEAGIGSSPIAHAAAKTNEPASEGVVALLEPFIDTVVVCTMTALVIIFSGYDQNSAGLEGTALTSAAFSSSIGEWAVYMLSFSVFLFAFSTMISWSYYGKKAFTYLFGDKKSIGLIYNVVFLIFIVIGTSIGLGAVLDFSDLLILAMAFPNILGLVIMAKEVKEEKDKYFRKIKSGEIFKTR